MSVLFASASSQYATIPSTSLTQNRAGFTMICSILPNSVPTSGNERRVAVFSINGVATASRVTLTHRNSGAGGHLRGFSRRLDADAGEQIDSAGGTLAAGDLHTLGIVCGWATQSFGIWIDGVEVANSAPAGWTANSSNTASTNNAIGARQDNTQHFDGYIEGLACWAAALDAQTMRHLHITRGAVQNMRTLGGAVSAGAYWAMRGELPIAPGTLFDWWGQGVVDATTVNSPVYDRHLAGGPTTFPVQ
jgi:hypothetical protein